MSAKEMFKELDYYIYQTNNDIIVGYCLEDNDAPELLNILQGEDKDE